MAMCVRRAWIVCILMFAAVPSIDAQPAAQRSDWSAVRNLVVGEPITVVTSALGRIDCRMVLADESALVVARPFGRLSGDVVEAMRRIGPNWPAVLGGRVVTDGTVRISSTGVSAGASVVASLVVLERAGVVAVLQTRGLNASDVLLDIAGFGAFFAASGSISTYDLEARRRHDALPGSAPLTGNTGSAQRAGHWRTVYEAPARIGNRLSDDAWQRLLQKLPAGLRGGTLHRDPE